MCVYEKYIIYMKYVLFRLLCLDWTINNNGRRLNFDTVSKIVPAYYWYQRSRP